LYCSTRTIDEAYIAAKGKTYFY